jgi:hypothetical protein
LKVSRKLRKYLLFPIIAVALIGLACALTMQLLFTYMVVRGIFLWAEVETVYAYDWLISGNDKIDLRFESNENIYLHVSRDYLPDLTPGGLGPYCCIGFEAHLPDMITKKEYFKMNANKLQGANQFTVLPDQVRINLTLWAPGPGQSDASVFSEMENGTELLFTEKVANDMNGYAVYKNPPIPDQDQDTSLYIPILQRKDPFFVDCSGHDGVDQVCDIDFPFRDALNVDVTISPTLIFQSAKIQFETERFLDSIYHNSLPSSQP